MKKLFIIITLFSAIVLVSPKFIGAIVETEYQLALNKLNANPAITINSTTFNRNWYSGKVVTEMTVLLHHEEIDDLNIVIEDDLSFGPVIFTDEGVKFALSYSKSNISFTDLFIDAEVERFIKNKIHLSALLTFSKNIIAHLTIDEVSKEVDGNQIVSAKAVGKFVLENDSRLYGDFNWAGLSATTTDESFTIEEIKFSFDQTLITGSYYQGNAITTGDVDFSISALNAKNASGNQALLLSNLVVSAMSSVNNNLLEIKMNYHVDKLASAGQQLQNANLDVVLKGFNITVLQEINTLLTELSTADEEVFSSNNMNRLSAITAKLLAYDPVIEIEDFSVKIPEGKIESAMQVSIDKKLFDAANFMSIMSAINVTASGNAPTIFFANLGLSLMVEQYVKQGLIIQNENNLSFTVNFAQGQLNINGNVIPL
ncbi:MAG: DUF945 family protein [Colwellia sp.]|nr:DUF945 family protein [Colwellia sp.]